MSKLSVAVSTNRPSFWQRFCQSLVQNAVDLEVILVGPCPDRPQLPVPTRFITATAKPVACWEIGAREARGDFLCLAADDVVYTPGFLDAVVAAAQAAGPNDMFTARYNRNGVDQLFDMRMFGVPAMPLIPVCGLARTEAHHRLGGLEKRLDAVLWDVDVYMRLREAGGDCHLIPNHTCHELNPDHNNLLFSANKQHDRTVIEALWFRGGVPALTRASPVQSFTDAEAGTWRR